MSLTPMRIILRNVDSGGVAVSNGKLACTRHHMDVRH